MTDCRAERRVIHGEALAWMRDNPAEGGMSVVTSLPDVSEMTSMGLAFEGWRRWFIDAACAVITWVPEGGVAVFYQSDIRHQGVWIDKGYMVMRAAEECGASVIWHKIACRRAPGTLGLGRPSYSHMICISRGPVKMVSNPGPDVLPDAGAMSFSRAMGAEACRVACRFVRDATASHTIVDPFCGQGTVLAVANEFGLHAVGVDLSARRCKAARGATTAG